MRGGATRSAHSDDVPCGSVIPMHSRTLATCCIKWYYHDAIKAGQDSSPPRAVCKTSKLFFCWGRSEPGCLLGAMSNRSHERRALRAESSKLSPRDFRSQEPEL